MPHPATLQSGSGGLTSISCTVTRISRTRSTSASPSCARGARSWNNRAVVVNVLLVADTRGLNGEQLVPRPIRGR